MRIPSDLPQPPRRRRPPRRVGPRGRSLLIALVGLIIVLFASARAISGFFVESLWFKSVGHSSVFWDVLKTKVLLAVTFTVGFAALTYASLTIAERLAPLIRSEGPEEQVLQRYRELVGHRQGIVWVGTAVMFGLLAGVPAAAHWQEWMLFRSAATFGQRDAQFNTDVGFYIFRLPFLTYLVNWLFAAFVVVTLLTAVAHYLNGGIRLQPGGRRVTSQVKLHLSGLAAMIAMLKAADYWLQRYELTTSQRGYVDGATFTDVKAQLPALKLLLLISLLAAVLLIVNVWQRGWRLPVIAVGLWAIVASVAGTAYPAFVQRFQVEPSESTREAPYIDRNIKATRKAMGLDSVNVVKTTVGTIDADAAIAAAPALGDVRLLDPGIVGPTYNVKQAARTGYRIGGLDVDRYTIDGRTQQVVLAARELDSNTPLNTWEGRHLAYTHGYGLAFAPASRVAADGSPLFVDIKAPDNDLGISKPELYFGDGLSDYAIVGTNRAGGEESLDPLNPPYQGQGGVKLSSKTRRAAFAIHFGEYNLFGSRLITDGSQIMYHRDIRERVDKIAPFLRYDSDPYPVALGDRIYWVLDAYTTSSRYPYAERADVRQLDSRSGLSDSFNYVRNSVKAVVDAYDGTIKLYVIDETDPIIAAWGSAFPRLFTSEQNIPAGLAEHFRYPEDLFRVQTNVYARYQLEDVQQFYSQQLAWSVAQDAPSEQGSTQSASSSTSGVGGAPPSTATSRVSDSNTQRFDPYYTLFRAPNAETSDPSFVLLRPFESFSREDTVRPLKAFMTASGDPGTYGQLTAYVLQTPLDAPATVASGISQRFSVDLTLLDQRGSKIRFGDLQIVPTGDGLLYFRPWFSEGQDNPVPVLHSVSVTYGSRSERGNSLSSALATMFPGFDVDLGDREGETLDVPSRPPTTGSETIGTPEELLRQADILFGEAQAAKLKFDSKGYEEKIEQAYKLVARAAKLATGKTVVVVPPADTPATTNPAIAEDQASPPTTTSA
jgi:uncharacterized protein